MKWFIKILTPKKLEYYDIRDDEAEEFISYTQKDLMYNPVAKKFMILRDRDNWMPSLVVITSDEEIKPHDWLVEHDKTLSVFDFNSDLQEIVDRVNYWQKQGLYKRVVGKASNIIVDKLINGELKDGDEIEINDENKPIPF